MNSTLQLQQDRNSAIVGARAIMEKAKGRAMSAEEVTAFDAFETQARDITATLDREQRMAALGNIHTDGHGAIEVHNNAEDKPFANIGEFLQSVRSAAITPSAMDPRLQKRAPLGLNESVGA